MTVQTLCEVLTSAPSEQNYADTILVRLPLTTDRTSVLIITSAIQHIQDQSYRLHALILSRSPYLVHLMSTSPQLGGMRSVYVDLEHDPEVTQEVGFSISREKTRPLSSHSPVVYRYRRAFS